VGTGFWIIQAMLLVATLATAFYVERDNRRRDAAARDAPNVKVRISAVRGRSASAALPLRRERSVDGHTILRPPPILTAAEQTRLLVLRRWIQESRASRGSLYDDLVPDDGSADLLSQQPATVDRSPSPPPAPTVAGWSTRRLVFLGGMLLLAIACLGIWNTDRQMTALERAQALAPVRSSLVGHLTPGIIANPGKYLSAVNSSGGSVGAGQDPLQVLAMLDLKQAMDRYLALLLFGLALVVASNTGWTARSPRVAREGEPQPSSIGNDLVPFIVLAALFCAALSFFELA